MTNKDANTPQTISSVKLLICNTLKQMGIDPAPLCEAAGLSMPDMLHPMKRDNTAQLAHLMDLATEISADPGFVLQVASRINITTFSSFGASIISCNNLESALQRGQQLSELVSGSATYSVVKTGNRLTASLLNLFADHRLFDDKLVLLYIAGGLQVGRSLSSTNIIPVEVRLIQEAPENIEPFSAFFGCPVLFSQTENSITVSEEDMETPIAAQDPRLTQLAHDLAIKDLNKLTARTVAEEVCVRVESALSEGEPKIAAIASAMGLSPRSLQRKLAAENNTFAQLLDSTRKRMAHEMVLKPSEQIKNLAYDLGFSDQSNFNRAFKRWFSVSPTEYRRQFGND